MSPSSAAVRIARSAPRVAPMRGKEVDEALSLAIQAAEALGAGELTGKDAHQLSRVCFLSDPTSCHDPTLTPLSRPFHPLNTGEELGWLDSVRDAVTTNLRPADTAPTSPRSARSPRKVGTVPWDGGAIVRELVRHVTRTRLAMPRPGHDPKSTAPEPFPVLPLGSTLCSVAELRAMGPCASDLTRLWARSRRSDSDDEEDEDEDAPELNDASTAPVVPVAVVGRLTLAPALPVNAPGHEYETIDPAIDAAGLALADATGSVAVVTSASLPDARWIGKAVLATGWTRPGLGRSDIEGLGFSGDCAGFSGGSGGSVMLEVTSFACLEEDGVCGHRPPAMPSVVDAAVAPPRKKKGAPTVTGAVVAVSPVITLRDRAQRFFMAELGACPRCGAGDERGLLFNGETLCRWRPFLGAAMGGEFDASDGYAANQCGCVTVADTREMSMFKGDGDGKEIRLLAATAATTVVPNPAGPARLFRSVAGTGRSSTHSNVECGCASCARGATLGRLEASVVGPDPNGAGVVLVRPVGTRGRGIPFVPDLGVMSTGSVVPSLRAGATVALTHAHPVWKRATGDEDDDDDLDGDGWGLRAVGACVRTRVRTVTPSPSCAPAPTLTTSTEGNGDDGCVEVFTKRDVARACERGGIPAAVRLRDMAAALGRKFDCADPGQRRNANRLLVGKRKRSSVGGVGDDDASATGFDLDGALRRLGGEETAPDSSSNRRGQSIYHEFFTPVGLGGDERPVPAVPTLRSIVDAGVGSFADAVRAEVTAAETAGRRSSKSAAAALPFGNNAGAVPVDRVVVSSREFGGPTPCLLLGWLKEYKTGEGAREKRRYALTDHTHEIDVCLAGDRVLPPLPCMMTCTRWSLACEGAKESVAVEGYSNARDAESLPPRLAAPRCHLRFAASDVACAEDAFNDENAPPAARPEPNEIKSLSDVLVWVRGTSDGWHKGAGPPPMGGAYADPEERAARVNPAYRPLTQAQWPPRASGAPPFRALVVGDAYQRDTWGRGAQRVLKFRDVDTGDRCDGYADRTEDLPSGVGVGAVLVLENAKRGVSNTMQCYVKFTPGTRVTVEVPGHATLGPSRVPIPAPLRSRTVRLADIAAAAAAGAGAVDNRLWQFRARVVSVNTLAVRWGCKFCGSDAGSMGAASAELAETSMRTHRRARAGVDDVEGIGAVLAGCGECRPRSASAAARAAAAERSCGFEVECNATLDDGTYHCDLWINGTAGEALLPPGLKSKAVALARRHGCVRATLAASSRDVGDDGPRFFSHDLRGYAGLPMSKVEGAPLVAAVGHAKSLGEMIVAANLSYKRWTEDKSATDFFGARSHPGPNALPVVLNGKPCVMSYAPIPKLRAVAVTPVECAREAAAALDALERRRRR